MGLKRNGEWLRHLLEISILLLLGIIGFFMRGFWEDILRTRAEMVKELHLLTQREAVIEERMQTVSENLRESTKVLSELTQRITRHEAEMRVTPQDWRP